MAGLKHARRLASTPIEGGCAFDGGMDGGDEGYGGCTSLQTWGLIEEDEVSRKFARESILARE